MKYFLILTIVILQFFQTVNAQTQLSFNRLDSLLKYAENSSISIKSGEQQMLLAKWQRISAKAGLVNFRMQTNFNLTDNIAQPVTFLPGEAFGGAPGTFKEVTTGQQYIGNFNIAPQIDIINPVNWAKLQSANVNSKLADINSLIAKKSLFESISASYHNIISLQEQIELTQKSLLIADTIFFNMQSKYTVGIVRQQDLNDAQINKLSLADKLEQLKLSLKQQYFSLKILCDIPDTTLLAINEATTYIQPFKLGLEVDNQLNYKHSLLKVDLASAELKTNHFMQLPTVSLVFYDAWQQNSNLAFFDKDKQWLKSQYLGLKITMPFPDINRFTQTKTSRINKTISLQNAEHAKLQTDFTNKQLVLDYEKAYSQFVATKQIYELKSQNYQLASNQFNADILPSDKLLIAFNDMIISHLNYSNSLANLLFSKSKIDINNNIR